VVVVLDSSPVVVVLDSSPVVVVLGSSPLFSSPPSSLSRSVVVEVAGAVVLDVEVPDVEVEVPDVELVEEGLLEVELPDVEVDLVEVLEPEVVVVVVEGQAGTVTDHLHSSLLPPSHQFPCDPQEAVKFVTVPDQDPQSPLPSFTAKVVVVEVLASTDRQMALDLPGAHPSSLAPPGAGQA